MYFMINVEVPLNNIHYKYKNLKKKCTIYLMQCEIKGDHLDKS